MEYPTLRSEQDIEYTSEENKRAVFQWYLNDLGLTEEQLKNKQVLDIGSGPAALFVDYCLEHNITNNIYAIENDEFGRDREYGQEIEGADKLKSKSRFIQAWGEELPFDPEKTKFDLITMR